jgi:hypothetical protein
VAKVVVTVVSDDEKFDVAIAFVYRSWTHRRFDDIKLLFFGPSQAGEARRRHDEYGERARGGGGCGLRMHQIRGGPRHSRRTRQKGHQTRPLWRTPRYVAKRGIPAVNVLTACSNKDIGSILNIVALISLKLKSEHLAHAQVRCNSRRRRRGSLYGQ